MRRFRSSWLLPAVLGFVVLSFACGDEGLPSSTSATGSDGGEPVGTPVIGPDGAIMNVTPEGETPFEPQPDGRAGECGGTASDPAGAAIVEGYMAKLPSPPPAGATRTAAIEAILKSCAAFGPSSSTSPGARTSHCLALLTAAISKESGYDAKVSVKDGYATRNINGTPANDPVVGLLQIRFSSTVHEMVALGSLDRLACVGCPIPQSIRARSAEAGSSSYWAVSGPTQNMALMQNVACNVGMGAWYYYLNATGNGKTSAVTYPDAYCKGTGTGGNLITGLLSHLKGSEGGRGLIANQGALNVLQGSDSGAYQYVTQVKGWFDSMIGPVTGVHPFFMKLAPNPVQYCR